MGCTTLLTSRLGCNGNDTPMGGVLIASYVPEILSLGYCTRSSLSVGLSSPSDSSLPASVDCAVAVASHPRSSASRTECFAPCSARGVAFTARTRWLLSYIAVAKQRSIGGLPALPRPRQAREASSIVVVCIFRLCRERLPAALPFPRAAIYPCPRLKQHRDSLRILFCAII